MDAGTAENQDWFNEQVTVQVDRDNRAWLDTLLEMNQRELQDFAIYRYQVPEAAARNVGRNELVQLVVMANRAGGGGSVLRERFRYLNHLKGLVPPFTQKVRGGRYLYITRGEGQTMQVYDKSRGVWVPAYPTDEAPKGRSVQPELPPAQTTSTEQPPAGDQPAPAVDSAAVAEIIDQTQKQTLALIVPSIHKLNRQEIEKIVQSLGVEDTGFEKFPDKADLITFVRNAAGVTGEPSTNEGQGEQENV